WGRRLMVAVDAIRDRLEGDRRHIGRMLCILLTTLLVLVAIVSLGYGASGVSAPHVLADWLAGRDIAVTDRVVMIDIRLPRLLTGILVGASLAVSGAVMQGLFRNPLADPG